MSDHRSELLRIARLLAETTARTARLVERLRDEPARKPSLTDLTDLQRRILAAATPAPQTARALARQAGVSYSGHFRGQLSALVDLGLILHVSAGYRLP